MHFATRAGQPRWSGPDSGVFADTDLLENFFALHTFQEEFRLLPQLMLECHIGDTEGSRDLSDEDVYARALDVLQRYFPDEDLRGRFSASRSRLLRHTDSFPLFAPGDESRRPTVSSPTRPNLMLAGDWVDTDDPRHRSFFMERAAVTGIEAANRIVEEYGWSEKKWPITVPRVPFVATLLSGPLLAWHGVRRWLRRAFGVE